jgi:lysozyme
MSVTNQAGIDLIKSFEKCELHAYKDAVGIWTVGWGHTGSDVKNGTEITQAEADRIFLVDLQRTEAGVLRGLTREVPNNQFAAMVSLAYNIGVSNFQNSTLLKLVNKRDTAGAAEQFLRWNKAGSQELLGLTRRRQAEKALFLTLPA